MSWLFTRPEGLDAFVNVRSPMLDDAAAWPPYIEVWTREKLPGASSGASRSYETVPEDDSWPELLADYARASPDFLSS